MTSFQKQTTIIILDCLDGLDSETFHDNLFFTIATAAVTRVPLYYKNDRKMSFKGYTFCNDNI